MDNVFREPRFGRTRNCLEREISEDDEDSKRKEADNRRETAIVRTVDDK
jgi:hypothetical protein